MTYGYVIYLDVLILFLAANFIFDYLLLWATAEVTRTYTSVWKLAAGASIGMVYFLLFWLSSLRIIPFYGILSFVPVVLGVTLAMLFVVFRPNPMRRILTNMGFFLLIGFIAAGAGMGAAYLMGEADDLNEFMGILVALAAILIVAELGWGVVQRRVWQRLYQLPVEVLFGNLKIRVNALVDTGNHLIDPLTGHPVIILEYKAISKILPEQVRPIVEKMEQGDLSSVAELLSASQWSSRFRVIPFASLGTQHGLLIGFRPDSITVYEGSSPIVLTDVVIGIHDQVLDRNGEYQALIHPKALEMAADAVQQNEHMTGGKSANAKLKA